MSFLAWAALASGVLLLMALASAYVKALPITRSALYLALGVALGPIGMGIVELDLVAAAEVVERVTTIGVIIALFFGGLRLRLSPRDPAWRAAFVLAGPVMVLSIAGIAAVAHLVCDIPLPSRCCSARCWPRPTRSSPPRSPSAMRTTTIACATACWPTRDRAGRPRGPHRLRDRHQHRPPRRVLHPAPRPLRALSRRPGGLTLVLRRGVWHLVALTTRTWRNW